MVLAAMTFNVLSYILATVSLAQYGNENIEEETPLMRDSRLASMFASTIAYSVVFDVYVFRMLLRLALYKANIPFAVNQLQSQPYNLPSKT